MELIKGIGNLNRSLTHPVISIGNFDGVHLGHQAIIRLAKERAEQRAGDCVAYTFRPHPQVALRPGAQVQLLSTYDEKISLLEGLGVDAVIEEPFSREFSQTEPNEFFNDVLLHRLSVEVIVVGYDFAFGKERHGHLDSLRQFCQSAGVELCVVSPQRIEGEVVSSSKIREHLLSGRIQEANSLLGRSFSYQGVVIKGEGRGRKLGFPTANLKIENKLTLPYGVYATEAIHHGKVYLSVTNVGVRPTFNEDTEGLPALVETHLIGTTIDLYGAPLEVKFLKKLRDEKRFASIHELKAQIALDIEQAEASFSVQ